MSKRIKMCTDRVLPDEDLHQATLNAINENPANAGPMASVAPDDLSPRERVRMAILVQKKWKPGRTLRIRFLDGDRRVKEKVKAHAMEWTRHANLRFRWVTSGKAEIRISFKESGSWSYLGTDALSIAASKPTMNFGWLTPSTSDAEYSRVVLHEFGHMLGAVHEHQHPANGIPWDKPAVYRFYQGPPNHWSKAQVDINMFRKYEHSQTQSSAFDPDSIMLYAIDDALTKGRYATSWNTRLSPQDIALIAAAYPSPSVKLHLLAIKCLDTQDWRGEDETYIKVDHRRVWRGNMRKGQEVSLENAVPGIAFRSRAQVDLYDEDPGFLGSDDHLGRTYVPNAFAGKKARKQAFFGAGAHYELTYKVTS